MSFFLRLLIVFQQAKKKQKTLLKKGDTNSKLLCPDESPQKKPKEEKTLQQFSPMKVRKVDMMVGFFAFFPLFFPFSNDIRMKKTKYPLSFQCSLQRKTRKSRHITARVFRVLHQEATFHQGTIR